MSIVWAASPGKQIRWNRALLIPAERLLRRLGDLVGEVINLGVNEGVSSGSKPTISERQWKEAEASLTLDLERISAFIADYRPNAALGIIDRRVTILARAMARSRRGEAIHRDDLEKLKRAVRLVVQVLGPFAPFHSEEMWEALGGTTLVSMSPWPVE
jgi:leucyl-tRNA synthetase